jgi:hypothetical protein
MRRGTWRVTSHGAWWIAIELKQYTLEVYTRDGHANLSSGRPLLYLFWHGYSQLQSLDRGEEPV